MSSLSAGNFKVLNMKENQKNGVVSSVILTCALYGTPNKDNNFPEPLIVKVIATENTIWKYKDYTESFIDVNGRFSVSLWNNLTQYVVWADEIKGVDR